MAADDHGSASTYVNHGCRCEPCTNAHTQKHREYMQRNPLQKAKARAYNLEYSGRPEVLERRREIYRIRGRSDEQRAKQMAYKKDYNKRPEVKERDAATKRRVRAEAWLRGETTENRIRRRDANGKLVTVGYKNK